MYITTIKNIFRTYKNYHNKLEVDIDEITNRILFLEERIAHYQNNSNNFVSLWLTLMSVLFITVTGFNLYNYNESKKILDDLMKEGKEKINQITENENLQIGFMQNNKKKD